jgi:hypothetical protein
MPGGASRECFCERGFYMVDWALHAPTGENKTCAECPRYGADCINDRIIAKVRKPDREPVGPSTLDAD